MSEQISFNLPEGVQLPRFQPFQVVRVRGRTAIVSGIYYTDFNTAIAEQSGYMGWNYVINYVMEKPKDQFLKLIGTDPTDELCDWQIDEWGVQVVEEAPKQ